MAVADTTCTADPTHDQMRRWVQHQRMCAACTGELRWYAGLGWHHYTRRPLDGVVFAEPAPVLAEVFTTSMPPRRALFELVQELAATASRPLLYLVPPLLEPELICDTSMCRCSLHGLVEAPSVPASILLAA